MAGGGFLVAKHTLVKHHFAQYHFRVFDKVSIERESILGFLYGNPWAVILVRHDFPFPLLQKENVRGGLCSRHLFERIVWEPDCP